jgi:hypothetical protein
MLLGVILTNIKTLNKGCFYKSLHKSVIMKNKAHVLHLLDVLKAQIIRFEINLMSFHLREILCKLVHISSEIGMIH